MPSRNAGRAAAAAKRSDRPAAARLLRRAAGITWVISWIDLWVEFPIWRDITDADRACARSEAPMQFGRPLSRAAIAAALSPLGYVACGFGERWAGSARTS